MTNERMAISAKLSAEIMFQSDRTCCVCNERGKAVQIHHIDENPANNFVNNLAVLCLECHNDTQISGGFGRKLNGGLVTKYRDEWIKRVDVQRIEADSLSISRLSGSAKPAKKVGTVPYSEERSKAILEYINSLPAFRKEQKKKAQSEWDSGVTARMVNASYDYVDTLVGVLVTLASFYPEGNFDDDDPHKFFSEIISSRYSWHRAHAEPYGPGTGGTIVNVLTASDVISDVEKMIKDMSMSLVGYDDQFDWKNWPRLWGEENELIEDELT